ncbi:MAG: RDD family protein [Tenericutes bacterium]|nr:RDD family protein [Mycoplasmatota bacterium]
MFASLFRRIASSFLDLILVLLVAYGIFFVVGQPFIQNRIDNFDIIYAEYNEIVAAYNEDLDAIQADYDTAIVLADEDPALEAIALENYNISRVIINDQNTIDINPYNAPLTQYFSEIIYFFVIGFMVLMTVLSLATVGKTPGRRILKISLVLEGKEDEFIKPSIVQVLLHDILLKYFAIILVFVFNMYYGIMFMLFALLVDVLLITFTRKRSTIRDYLSRLKVLKNTN